MKISGAARGCGWQNIGAIINLGAYYMIGLPAAIFLAFVLHVGGKVYILYQFLDYLFINIFFCKKFFLKKLIIWCIKNGDQGLWLGTMVALFVQAILLAIVTWRTNWEKEVNYIS